MKHPGTFGQIVQKLSIASEICYHSIIARENANGEVEKSTDGFVPYSSAFLPGADSTLVIQSGHHVQETNAAILEIRRILLLHSAAHAQQPESLVPSPRTDTRLRYAAGSEGAIDLSQRRVTFNYPTAAGICARDQA